MDEVERDDRPRGLDGQLDPVARVLRSAFDANNHDTLGSDLTGLMIDLSRVPFDAADRLPATTGPDGQPQSLPNGARGGERNSQSKLRRLIAFLRG